MVTASLPSSARIRLRYGRISSRKSSPVMGLPSMCVTTSPTDRKASPPPVSAGPGAPVTGSGWYPPNWRQGPSLEGLLERRRRRPWGVTGTTAG